MLTLSLIQRASDRSDNCQVSVCFLDARSASIYYHWMIDVLPKVALLEKAGIALKSIDHFMVRCDSAFQRQTLEHLGIPIEKVVSPWNDGLTTCQTLIVPFLKHDRGDRFYNGLGLGMATWVPQWLATRFVHSPMSTSLKLYISRSNRGTRAPIDEHKLVASLESRGFQCVTLESMSVVEQANLLSVRKYCSCPSWSRTNQYCVLQTRDNHCRTVRQLRGALLLVTRYVGQTQLSCVFC